MCAALPVGDGGEWGCNSMAEAEAEAEAVEDEAERGEEGVGLDLGGGVAGGERWDLLSVDLESEKKRGEISALNVATDTHPPAHTHTTNEQTYTYSYPVYCCRPPDQRPNWQRQTAQRQRRQTQRRRRVRA